MTRARVRSTWLAATIALLAALACTSHDGADGPAQATAAATDSEELTITLPPQSAIRQFALAAARRLEIGSRAEIGGPVASMGLAPTIIGAAAVVGEVRSRASVDVGSRARVQGRVQSGGNVIVRPGAFTGPVERGQGFEPPVVVERTIVFPGQSRGDRLLLRRQRLEQPPGRYRQVRVAAGATLVLRTGAYYVETLSIDRGATLQLDETYGPVEIFVRRHFVFQGELESNVEEGLFVAVLGREHVRLDAPFSGTLVAPNADVTLGAPARRGHARPSHGRSTRRDRGEAFVGSFYGRHVTVEPGVEVVHRPSRALESACIVCPEPENTCLAAVCSEFTGHCLVAPANARQCKDGDRSTTGELCISGSCRLPRARPPGTDSVYEPGLVGLGPDRVNDLVDFEKHVKVMEDRFEFQALAVTRADAIVIPVIFHIPVNPGLPVIETATVHKALETLNRQFGELDLARVRPVFQGDATPTRIQFAFAKRSPTCGALAEDGIERVMVGAEGTSVSFSGGGYADVANGGIAAWPEAKYLNVWVFPSDDGLSGVFVRTVPSGIAIQPQFFDPGDPPGDTVLTHEVAHWLELHHVYDDTTCASVAACETEGDYVCDTPAASSSQGCVDDDPATPEPNTCTADSLTDQLENYMNNGDVCRSMFSFGQSVRMEAALAGEGLEPDPLRTRPRELIQGSDGLYPPVAAGDLWASDGAGDTGQVPSAVEVPWASSDIWVRRQPGDNLVQHENPVFPGAPNHVFVRVRNLGCQTAAASTITVYWAKASTGLSWPESWDGSQTLPGTSTPLGDEVGTAAIPELGPGEFHIVDLPWNNLPDPAAFDGTEQDDSHFCLLAVIGPTPPANPDIVSLVTGSNDIVWKNVTVASDEEALEARFTVHGTTDAPSQQLSFTDPGLPGQLGSVFDWSVITVDLGPTLFGRWVNGGSQGTAVSPAGGTLVTLLASGATIANLALGSSEPIAVGVHFEPKVPASSPRRPSLDVYALDATQRAELPIGPPDPPEFHNDAVGATTRLVGGQRIYVKTRAPLPLSDDIPPPE